MYISMHATTFIDLLSTCVAHYIACCSNFFVRMYSYFQMYSIIIVLLVFWYNQSNKSSKKLKKVSCNK